MMLRAGGSIANGDRRARSAWRSLELSRCRGPIAWPPAPLCASGTGREEDCGGRGGGTATIASLNYARQALVSFTIDIAVRRYYATRYMACGDGVASLQFKHSHLGALIFGQGTPNRSDGLIKLCLSS
jgi:hypothetical protein